MHFILYTIIMLNYILWFNGLLPLVYWSLWHCTQSNVSDHNPMLMRLFKDYADAETAKSYNAALDQLKGADVYHTQYKLRDFFSNLKNEPKVDISGVIISELSGFCAYPYFIRLGFHVAGMSVLSSIV